jgi:hypothetical protein
VIEHIIVAVTGLGYAIVGVLQLTKGATGNAVMWIGYAVAQVGLFVNLK